MIDCDNGLVQVLTGTLLAGDGFLPVPLIHVDGVKIIQFFVPPDRVHIRIQAAAGFNSVFAERMAFPFGQRLYDFRGLFVHVF